MYLPRMSAVYSTPSSSSSGVGDFRCLGRTVWTVEFLQVSSPCFGNQSCSGCRVHRSPDATVTGTMTRGSRTETIRARLLL
jgi:hypothetical protein